jgi:hypothetical protein
MKAPAPQEKVAKGRIYSLMKPLEETAAPAVRAIVLKII